MRWVGLSVVDSSRSLSAWGKKLFLILRVLAPRLRQRLPHGSASKSLWLGWLGSLMTLSTETQRYSVHATSHTAKQALNPRPTNVCGCSSLCVHTHTRLHTALSQDIIIVQYLHLSDTAPPVSQWPLPSLSLSPHLTLFPFTVPFLA